jgi:hypothetical protein
MEIKHTRVDRNAFLAESVCAEIMASSLSSFKHAILIAIAIVLAPIVLVGLAAFAAGDWRSIGATAEGDQILISSLTAQKNGSRTAWVRVEYKEPTRLPQGGPFVELRARVHFNCLSGSAVPNSEWFYTRDHGGKLIVGKKLHRDDQFGNSAEGGFGEIAREFVCKQR